MLSSESLLINIQLAIMGIVVVAGLFYLWRMICRVEKKVDDFIDTYIQTMMNTQPQPHQVDHVAPPASTTTVILNDAADDFMNEVFGGMGVTPTQTTVPSVHVEEECAQSEAETQVTTTTPITKTKLKKMSVDTLKEVCKERGLSTDGTKAALQDRILATMDEANDF